MCFGGDGGQTVTSSTKLPSWYEDAAKANVKKAQTLAKRDYPQYSGPRLADFTADQQAGFDLTRRTAGAYQPYLGKAGDLLTKFGDLTWADADQASYMNPYMDQVTNATVEEIRRAGNVDRAQLERAMTAEGAWGDARHGVVEAENLRNQNTTIANTIASGKASAYNQALQAFNADRQAQLAAASGLMDYAGTGQQMGYRDAAALLGTGGQQQQQQQSHLDLGYQDFWNEFNFPIENLNLVTSTLGGTPYSQTTTSTQPGGNSFATNLGAFGALVGGLGSLGGSEGLSGLWPF